MQELSKEEKRARWAKILLLNEQTDLENSMLRELADYQGTALEAVRNNCLVAKSKLAEEWERFGYQAPLKYYINTKWYLYDQTMYHIQTGPYEAAIDFLGFCISKGLKKVLDFGGGIGSLGIIFAKQGLEVTIGEISKHLLDYAKWRFKRRSLDGDFVDLMNESLPQDHFDVVIATDVMEHLAKPAVEISKIYTVLKEGGYFLFNIVETSGCEQPMHITRADTVIREMRRLGFRRVKGISSAGYGYQKVVRRRWENCILGFFDRIYYSLYFSSIPLLKRTKQCKLKLSTLF